MKKLNIFTLALILAIKAATAQPFIPDNSGYVANPKFRAFIKDNGYALAETFTTIQEKPLIAYAKVLKNGQWLLIDTYGKAVLHPQNYAPNSYLKSNEIKGDVNNDADDFDSRTYVHPSNVGLQVSQKDDKVGLMNIKTNKVIIPVIYEGIQLSNFKFVMVKLHGKWGTISKQGLRIIPPQYDEVKSLGVNMAGSKTIIADAIIMRVGNKWGLLSNEGMEIVSPQFDKIESSWVINSLLTTKVNNKWGLMNKNGKELIRPVYNQIQSFDSNGDAIVTLGDNQSVIYGLIDSLGRELVKPTYKKINYVDKNLFAVYVENFPNAMIGLVDAKGKELCKPIYKYISNFRNNMAMVHVNKDGRDKVGYIDNTGREIIKPIYDDLDDPYGRGIYKTLLNGKYGLMNNRGEYLLKPIYDVISGITMNIYIVKKDSKYGAIDINGKELIPIKYDHDLVANYKKGLMKTYRNDKRCTIDLYGNEYFN